MGTLLIGYDVECLGIPGRGSVEETRQFLKSAVKVHQDLHVPGTMFIVGKTLEANREQFAALRRQVENLPHQPLFEFASHTYSHEGPVLKTIAMEAQGRVMVFEGMTLEQIDEEIGRTQALLKEHLSVDNVGLRGPWGYYRGLSDRPDILRILHRHGIRYTSTYARNEKDFTPVEFEVQPFWYEPQGLPDILEIPVQGIQDLDLRDQLGWENLDGLVDALKEYINLIAERDLAWGFATHDHSGVRTDPEMTVMRRVIEYALEKSLTIITYREFYERELAQRLVPA